eukprot:185173_1
MATETKTDVSFDDGTPEQAIEEKNGENERDIENTKSFLSNITPNLSINPKELYEKTKYVSKIFKYINKKVTGKEYKTGHLYRATSNPETFDRVYCKLEDDMLYIFLTKPKHNDAKPFNKYDLKTYDVVESIKNDINEKLFKFIISSTKSNRLKTELFAATVNKRTAWVHCISNAQSNCSSQDEEKKDVEQHKHSIQTKYHQATEKTKQDIQELQNKMNELEYDIKTMQAKQKPLSQQLLTLVHLEEFLPLILLDKVSDGIGEDDNFVVNQYNEFIKLTSNTEIIEFNQYEKFQKFQGFILKEHELYENNKNKLRRNYLYNLIYHKYQYDIQSI